MAEPAPKRGRTHDAEGAREAILNAAEQVFAEHGFDGARIDAIAAASGYNKSLIFQYFDDKLGLYSAVIRRADDQTRDLQAQILAALLEDDITLDADRFKASLSSFLRAYFDYLVLHPQVRRIFIWEMAEGWQTYAKIVSQRDFEDIEQFRPVFEKIQKAGLLRSDFDPLAQVIIIEFLHLFYMACLPMFQLLMPAEDYSSEQALARASDFIIDFIIHGLLTDVSERVMKAASKTAP